MPKARGRTARAHDLDEVRASGSPAACVILERRRGRRELLGRACPARSGEWVGGDPAQPPPEAGAGPVLANATNLSLDRMAESSHGVLPAMFIRARTSKGRSYLQ